MDTFIFGKQGAGKTSAARKLTNDFIDVHKGGTVLLVTPEDFKAEPLDTAVWLGDFLLRTEADVIIFDGVIITPEDLTKALNAVKWLRTMREHKDKKTLAIYVVQGESSDFITYRYGN